MNELALMMFFSKVLKTVLHKYGDKIIEKLRDTIIDETLSHIFDGVWNKAKGFLISDSDVTYLATILSKTQTELQNEAEWQENTSSEPNFLMIEENILDILFWIAEGCISPLDISQKSNKDGSPVTMWQVETTEIVLRRLIDEDSNLRQKKQIGQLNHLVHTTMDTNSKVSAMMGMFGQIHTDNSYFSKSLLNPLFLHKSRLKDEQVSLKQLYCIPKITDHKGLDNSGCYPPEHLNRYLKDFFHSADTNVLFIEGNAGVGKSSLCADLVYRSTLTKSYFNKYPLISVRLRNMKLSNRRFDTEEPVYDLLHYLYPKSMETTNDLLDRLQRDFPYGLILWLDGFDELCISGGSKDSKTTLMHYLYQMCASLCLDWPVKIVITTRQKYLEIRQFLSSEQAQISPLSYGHITLNPFDRTMQDQWCMRYLTLIKEVNCCDSEKRTLNLLLKRPNLEDKKENEQDSIFGSPLTLYMATAGAITKEELENRWALFHRIFYKDVFSQPQNMKKSEMHPIVAYRQELYQLTTEIAHHMYLNGNQGDALLVSSNSIKQLIKERLSDKLDSNKLHLLEFCYALCCYWKPSGTDGAVEFYHNDIRDFFLAEKIRLTLDKLYAEPWNPHDVTPYFQIFNYLFGSEKPSYRVYEFLSSYSEWSKIHNDTPSLVIQIEQSKESRLQTFFTEMLITGGISQYTYSPQKSVNLLECIKRMISSVFSCYHSLLTPRLDVASNEKLHFWHEKDITKINESRIFFNLFIPASYIHRLSMVDLSRIVLAQASLQSVDMRGANLAYAVLRRANMMWAKIDNADFSGTDLHEARLYEATYENAVNIDLTGAIVEKNIS